ncbi:PilZ domain-containing protein [Pseudomaricurvus alkylphenolicus]|jgi:Tfp pilus assembly protein PilZ|uniref:PilZ domain-containing protein n=1 Tax=Pseudomaricurvus alkylphenolicus TaxID=1306991 RepID=UPI001422929A|nr:PilZ domain-containing protein [Pseudomaricurvus alkylphenolicus]NIB41373.1 PilZ domain-containing protein [Pseudomaricurvus alkylphenolicus]
MNEQDNRQEYRLTSNETVFIEVAAASPDGLQPAEILVSNSLDISANGLQVKVNQPIELNTLLQVAIQLQDQPRRIHLTTEVKWVGQISQKQEWMLGLQVLASDDTGLAEWKNLVADRLSPEF